MSTANGGGSGPFTKNPIPVGIGKFGSPILNPESRFATKPHSLKTSIIFLAYHRASKSDWSVTTITSFLSMKLAWLNGFNMLTKLDSCAAFIVLHCTANCSFANSASAFAARSFASPASLDACSVLSCKSAISNPDNILIPRAAITSITIPLIKMRQPRSSSVFCFSEMSLNMSPVKLSGTAIFSAFFSTFKPQYTTIPPEMLKATSSQNQGEQSNFWSKCIYLGLSALPLIGLFSSPMAILW